MVFGHPRLLVIALIVSSAFAEEFSIGLSGGIRNPESVLSACSLDAQSLRLFIRWGQFEYSEGNYRMMEWMDETLSVFPRKNLTPLPVLAGGSPFYEQGGYPASVRARAAFFDFASSAASKVARYASKIEIWNEWNRGQDMPEGTPRGDPDSYVALLEYAYPRLKKAYPDIAFIGGAMEGIGRFDHWTRRALDAGMLEHLDGLSFHPYVYWMGRNRRIPERGMEGLVGELEALLARYPKGKEVPLYVTEIGWPTHEGRDGVSLPQQADYLSRAIFLLRANPRVKGVWVHALRDREGASDDREAHFGLLFPDGSPKPSWFAFRDTARILENVAECRRIDFGEHSDAVAGVEMIGRDGSRSLAVWTLGEKVPWQVTVASRSRPNAGRFRTSVVGRGCGPGVPSRSDPDLGRIVEMTVGPSPTILFSVGAYWRLLKSSPLHGNE